MPGAGPDTVMKADMAFLAWSSHSDRKSATNQGLMALSVIF
jgi:hypothetical protein